ncbi:uncharacterized protein RCC_11268 [Ramularia collo-cygni]|uniref:Oxidase ustYa n=1 Tax=Ramularia collo-cygni TaxID=112498 RepID=A0A2D3VHK1_9PEZI|nr:uncharacterized protein RCC_11268 [Ramularia collo-cygni]CZT25535.1 uncharacterized protein RCC_11268 [Ramularia collo-cygni]
MEKYTKVLSSESEDEPSPTFRERKRQRKCLSLPAILIGMLAGSLMFNVVLLSLLWRAAEHSNSCQPVRNLAEEVNGLIPKVPLKTVVFRKAPEYIPYDQKMNYTEKDQLVATTWKKAFMPEGRGFLTVDNPEDYVLVAPLTTPNGTAVNMYGMAAFHGVHCLGLIFRAYLASTHGHKLPASLAVEHVYHCFDYVRQSLMCAGDMALEGITPGSNITDRTLGLGATHICKDWDALMDLADELAKPLDVIYDQVIASEG